MGEQLGIHLITIEETHKIWESQRSWERKNTKENVYYSKSLHSNNVRLYIPKTSKKEIKKDGKPMQNDFVKIICGVLSIPG